jgi:hypothetical protein
MTQQFGSGPIDEVQTQLDYAYDFLDVNEMGVTIVDAGAGPHLYSSLGAGAPAMIELSVAAAEQNGLLLDTADEVYWRVPLLGRLSKFNFSHDIHSRLLFETGGNITPTGADFRLAAKGVANGEAFSDAKVSPDVSLDYPDFVTTAGAIAAATGWMGWQSGGSLNGLFEPAGVPDLFLQVAVTLNSRGSAAADQIRLLGVELRGTQAFASSTGFRKVT